MNFLASLSAAVVIATMAANVPSAHAQVVDFEDVPSGSCNPYGASIDSRGYSFAGSDLFLCDAGAVATNTSAALIDANHTSMFTMQSSGGSPFTLNSFEAASRSDNGSDEAAASVTLTGNLAGGGTITETFNFAGDSYGVFTPTGFDNVTSVSFLGVGPGAAPQFVIDNITVNAAPEPGAWAMMIGGFALVGGLARRRPKRRMAVARA